MSSRWSRVIDTMCACTSRWFDSDRTVRLSPLYAIQIMGFRAQYHLKILRSTSTCTWVVVYIGNWFYESPASLRKCAAKISPRNSRASAVRPALFSVKMRHVSISSGVRDYSAQMRYNFARRSLQTFTSPRHARRTRFVRVAIGTLRKQHVKMSNTVA